MSPAGHIAGTGLQRGVAVDAQFQSWTIKKRVTSMNIPQNIGGVPPSSIGGLVVE